MASAVASNADPTQDKVFKAALEVFRENGLAAATLEQIAQRAGVEPETLRSFYRDKDALFAALLAAHTPLKEIQKVLDDALATSDDESAESVLRSVMHQMVDLFEKHAAFIDLAAMDVQNNNGSAISNMSTQLMPKALKLLERLKSTGELRPVSDVILARTLIAMFIGFVASERAMPQIARFAMRLFPQRAWLNGTIDLMLYGILEDDAR